MRYRSLRQMNRSNFYSSGALVINDFLQIGLLPESIEYIPSLDSLNLKILVLVNEIINMHESSTNSHFNGVTLLNLKVDFSLTKLVHSFGLSQEHDSELFPLWELLDVMGKRDVDVVGSVADVVA